MSVTARSVVCNLLLNQLFVLTQHPSKHQLLSNSPGKAIRACAPKVLSEPGPQLDWSGSGSGLVAAWLTRGEHRPSITPMLTSGQFGNTGISYITDLSELGKM